MKERLWPGFVYNWKHLDAKGKIISLERSYNLFPLVGVNYMLGAAFAGVSQYSTFYLGVYEANRTPVSADTMTTLLADCQESVAYTVTGGARQEINFSTITDGEMTSAAHPNTLVFTAGATIYGGFITTNVTRGNNAGLLVSAVKNTTAKTLAIGESLVVDCGFALISA